MLFWVTHVITMYSIVQLVRRYGLKVETLRTNKRMCDCSGHLTNTYLHFPRVGFRRSRKRVFAYRFDFLGSLGVGC